MLGSHTDLREKYAEKTTTVQNDARWSSRRVLLGFGALVVIAMAATVLKSASWFLHPPLYCEDGLFFSYYRNNDGLQHILWFYRGYVSIVPNAVAYLTKYFPVTFGPYLLSGWALLAGALARSAFALARFRPIMGSDRARWFVSLALVVWPVGDFAMSQTGCENNMSNPDLTNRGSAARPQEGG